MRHDDGANNPHRLSQLDGPTALAVWDKHPLQQVRLVWSHCHVLDDTEEKRLRLWRFWRCRTTND